MTLLLSIAVFSVPFAADWTQRGGDSEITHFTLEKIGLQLEPAWYSDFGGARIADLACDDGFLVSSDVDGVLTVFEEDFGSPLAQWQASGSIVAGAAISNGRVYATSLGGELACLTLPDLDEVWRIETGGQNFASPIVVGATVVQVVGFPVNSVQACDALTGAPLWQTPLPQVSNSTPALHDGFLYFGANDGGYRKLSLEAGAIQWTFDTPGLVQMASPAIDVARGSMITAPGGADANVYSIALDEADWDDNWTFPLTDPAPPSVGTMLGMTRAVSSILVTETAYYIVVRFDYNMDTDTNFVADTFPSNEYLYAIDPDTHALLWRELSGTVEFGSPGQVPELSLCPTPVAGVSGGQAVLVTAASLTAELVTRIAATGEIYNGYELELPARSSPILHNGRVTIADDAGWIHSYLNNANRPPDKADGLAPSGNVNVLNQTPTLSWNTATDFDDDIVSLLLRLDDDGEIIRDHDLEIELAADTTSYDVSILLADDTQYTWALRVLDSHGAWSTWSEPAKFWVNMNLGTTPLPPSNFIALPFDQTVELSWTRSPSPDVAYYEILVSDDEGPVGSPYQTAWNASSQTVHNLDNRRAYHFELKAVDFSGLESSSLSADATPVEPILVNGETAPSLSAALQLAGPMGQVRLGIGTFELPAGIQLPYAVTIEGYSPSRTVIVAGGNGIEIEGSAGLALESVEGEDPETENLIANLTIVGDDIGIVAGSAASLTVRNVIVRDCQLQGLLATGDATVNAINCTFARNGASGIYAGSGAVTVRNCILWGNGFGISCAEGVSVNLSHNNLQGNAGGDYVHCAPGPGDFDDEPTFVDEPHDDFHVLSGAPTVDAGSKADAYPLEAAPRGTRINVGAYGNTPEAALSPGLFIVSTQLSDGETNAPYLAAVNIAGGQPPYLFEVTDGALPPGLALDAVSGDIAGTVPLGESGQYDFTLRVTDDFGVQVSDEFQVNVDKAQSPSSLHILGNALGNGRAGLDYTYHLLGAGGFPGYTWTISNGALPKGLSLDAATGEVSGVVSTSAAGEYEMTVALTDADGVRVERDMPMLVTEAIPLSSGGGGGCFIATAAYGSLLHPYVKYLRAFRDEFLLTHAPGRLFVRTYYAWSPPLADWIARHAAARFLVRLGLLPLILAAWSLTTFGLAWSLLFMTMFTLASFTLVRRALRRLRRRGTPRRAPRATALRAGAVVLLAFTLAGLPVLRAASVTSISNSPDPVATGVDTTITAALSGSDDVEVTIRDTGGALVKRFFSGVTSGGGLAWNQTDDAGASVALGTYTATARSNFSATYNTKAEGNGILLNTPFDVAVLSNGSYIVCDSARGLAQKFSANGQLLVRFVGSLTDSWTGIAVDPSTGNATSGRVYIANNTTDKIEEWSSTGTLLNDSWYSNASLTDLAGMGSDNTYLYVAENTGEKVFRIPFASPGSGADLGLSTTKIQQPADVAVDSAGNIYVANTNGRRVNKFDSNGQNGVNWNVGASSERHSGIWITSQDEIYVSSNTHDLIRKLDTSGNEIDFSPYGSTGSGNDQFASPRSIGAWYDAGSGETKVYVIDSNNSRIQVYWDDMAGSDPAYDSTVVSDPSNVTEAQDIFIDPAGNVYVVVASEHVVKKFSPYGVLLFTIGGYGLPGSDGKFASPRGVCVDSQGYIYVSDEGDGDGGRIQKFDSSGAFDSVIVFISGGQANKRFLGMDINDSDEIYAARRSDKIYKYDTSGNELAVSGDIGADALDVVVNWDGRVYAVDDSKIVEISANLGSKTNLVTGLTLYGGVEVDEFGNIYVTGEFTGGAGVRKYSPAGAVLAEAGTTGTGNGQFQTPYGIRITNNEQYMWIADSTNDRLTKMAISWESTLSDTITINAGSGSAPVINDIQLSDPSPTKAGVVTFTVVFDQDMDTGVSPTVKFTVNGQETTVTETDYTNNVWTGTATVVSGNDGVATISVGGAVDAQAQTQSVNPDVSHSFTIDTTSPNTPTVYPPASPTTTLDQLAVSGTAEANSFVDLYVDDADGTDPLNDFHDAQLSIPVDGSGNWTSNPLLVMVGTNYYSARVTDAAGNQGSFNEAVTLERVLAGPGTSSISPTAQSQIGDTGTWTLTYTADSEMQDGTVTFAMPEGWTEPTGTSSVAGYTVLGGSNTIMGLNSPTFDGRTVTVTFDSAEAGDFFDLIYGDTSGGGPGATISSEASLGTNQFILRSGNNGGAATSNVPSLQITVKGVDLKASHADQAPGTVFAGQSDVKMMSLTFVNNNVAAGDEVQTLVFKLEDDGNSAVSPPSSLLSKMVIKDLSTTYATKTSIETSGSTISMDLSASPILIPAGQSKTVDVYIDVKSTAAGDATFKLNLNAASSVTARDEDSQSDITVVANAGDSFPMRSDYTTVQTTQPATQVNITRTQLMPATTSKGHTSLKTMKLTFSNATSSPPPNTVKITQLVLTLQNSGGTPLVPFNTISNIKLQNSGGGAVILSRAVVTGDNNGSGRLTLDLNSNPIYVLHGTDKDVDVIVNVKASTSAASLQVKLNADTDVTASDNVTASAITAAGGFPLASGSATVQTPPTITVTDVRVSPSTMILGTAFEVEVDVTSAAGAGVANATVIDAAGDLVFSYGTVGDKTVEFSVTPDAANPSSIAPGATATLVYDVIQDLGASVGNGTLTVDTSATGPVVRDANDAVDADPLAVSDLNGSASTGGATVNVSSADATVTGVSTATPAAGASKVLVLDFTIQNNLAGADTLSQIKLTSKNTSDVNITNVRVFREFNGGAGNGFNASEDSQELTAGTNTFSGGTLILNVSQNNSLPGSGTNGGLQRFYVVYDLQTTVTDGHVLDVEIPVNGLTLANAGQIESFKLDSTGNVTINVVATRIVVEANTGAAAVGGTESLSIKALDASGNVDTGNSQSVTIVLSPTPNISVTATTLNGGNTGSSATNGTLTAGQASVTITCSDEKTVTVTPNSALGTNTADTVDFSQQISAVANAVTDTAPAPGATDALILDLTIDNGTASTDTVTQMVIQSLNTLDSEVKDIDIFRDNGNGVLEPGTDTELTGGTSDTFVAGSKTFALSQAISPGTSARFFVTYDLQNSGVDNHVLDAKIPAGGITLTTAGTVGPSLLNSSGTVTLEVVANRILVTATDGTAPPGQTEACTIKALDANDNVDLDSSQQVQIILSGSAQVQSTTLSGATPGGSSTTGTLTNGQATVTVSDTVGETVNVTPSSALATNTGDAVTFEVDSTPPAAPAIDMDGSGNIVGSPSSDDTPTITGTAEADSTVKLYDGDVNPGNLIGSGIATGGGTFSITVSSLSTGVHDMIYATATDQADNVSEISDPASYEVIGGTVSSSGVIEGFPTMALDWNTFSYYGGYVAYRNVDGANNDKIIFLDTAGVDTGKSLTIANANGDIVGIPIWDTLPDTTKVIYFGTTTGNVYRAEHDGSWNMSVSSGYPVDIGNAVTSAMVTDRNSLFFGGIDGSSGNKIFVFDLLSLTTASPAVSAISTVSAFPALNVAGSTTYAYVGSTSNGATARISSVDDTNETSFNTGVNADILAAITYSGGRVHAADLSGNIHVLGTDMMPVAGNPFYVAGAPVRGSIYRHITTGEIYFGDDNARIHIADADGSSLSGWPKTYGSSSFENSGRLVNGVYHVGNSSGVLYAIRRSDGAVRQTWNLGAGAAIGPVAYAPSLGVLVVGTAAGDVFLIPPAGP